MCIPKGFRPKKKCPTHNAQARCIYAGITALIEPSRLGYGALLSAWCSDQIQNFAADSNDSSEHELGLLIVVGMPHLSGMTLMATVVRVPDFGYVLLLCAFLAFFDQHFTRIGTSSLLF